MKLLWLSLNFIPKQWVCFALALRCCAKEIAAPFGSVCLGLGGIGLALIRNCVFCIAVGVIANVGRGKTMCQNGFKIKA